jgi:desulfoferrodoxin (superoxide reductase-like protein)
MKFRNLAAFNVIVFSLILLSSPLAFADKAMVSIEAPQNPAKGSEITIRITITHNGNSNRHFVDWVKIWANNQELAKWEYTSSKLPEGVPFTREIKYKIEDNVEIKAEANCNIHGGKGPGTLKITVK